MKKFDGREKSLLRHASSDLLPESILQRVKSPYPSTADTGYEKNLLDELADVAASTNAPVLPLLDLDGVRRRLERPLGESSSQITRIDLEIPLWLNAWLDSYGVSVEL